MILILIISHWVKKDVNVLLYDVVYKTPYGARSLRIAFDKVDGYFRKLIELHF